jgi:uncharacterized membrane protein
MLMTETRSRSLAKAVSYRAISSLLTGSILFGATQRARMAVALALIDSIVKLGVFYLHERAWSKIIVRQVHREGNGFESDIFAGVRKGMFVRLRRYDYLSDTDLIAVIPRRTLTPSRASETYGRTVRPYRPHRRDRCFCSARLRRGRDRTPVVTDFESHVSTMNDSARMNRDWLLIVSADARLILRLFQPRAPWVFRRLRVGKTSINKSSRRG